MSYSICYSPEFNKKYPRKMRGNNKRAAGHALLIMVAIALLACFYYRETITQWVFPNSSERAAQSVAVLTEQVRSGAPVGDAITEFCLEILSDAEQNP